MSRTLSSSRAASSSRSSKATPEPSGADRRKQYRVTAEFDELVQIEFRGPKLVCDDVRLLDLSAGGAGVELPDEANGLLRMRDRISLSMRSPKLSEPLEMSARICHLDERRARPKVGLSFESWRDHRALLDSELRSLFNEREAFRVEPSVADPIEVEVHAKAGRLVVHGEVRDLSVLGFGLWMPVSSLDHLRPGARVALHFQLPGEDEVVTAPCQIRFMRREEGRARAISGLRMAEGLRVQPRTRQAVTRYVMNRQRELLRMGLREEESAAVRVVRA